MKKIQLLTLAALASAFAFTGCTKFNPPPNNLVDIVTGDQNFSLLTRAIGRIPGLGDALRNGSNLTVFAPNDDAFAASGLSQSAIDGLSETVLGQVLSYHVVPTTVLAGNIPAGSSSAPSLLPNTNIFVSNNQQGIFLNGVARVIRPNIPSDNATVHVIDQVIMPPSGNIVEGAIANPNLSLLVQAVVKCGLTDVLAGPGPFTVFAPTNAAFTALGFTSDVIENATGNTLNTLTNVLLYHVVPGRFFSTDLGGNQNKVTAGGGSLNIQAGARVRGNGNATPSNITVGNGFHTNGLIHVIDQVLLP